MTTPAASPVVRVPAWTREDRLRKAREEAGLTQKELADEIGVSKRSVINYEGGATVKRPVLLAWAFRCAVPLLWLTDGIEGEPGPGVRIG